MKVCIQSGDTVYDFGADAAYRMIREAGFEGIDWNIDHSWKFSELRSAEKLEGLCIFEKSEEEILQYYKAELDAIKKNGLEISQAHAPMPAYDYRRPEILDYAIEIYEKIIRFCAVVGCRNLIIHGVARNTNDKEMTPKTRAKLNAKLYESLIPTLREVDCVKVCLENCFSTDKGFGDIKYRCGYGCDPHSVAAEIDRLNELAGLNCFGFCLDTGHLHLLRVAFEDFIPVLGNRIAALHIHDNSQSADSHLMPYAGSIDWGDFVKELKNIEYSGNLSFETFAQTWKKRLPEALVPVFLETIAKTGKYFRQEISCQKRAAPDFHEKNTRI